MWTLSSWALAWFNFALVMNPKCTLDAHFTLVMCIWHVYDCEQKQHWEVAYILSVNSYWHRISGLPVHVCKECGNVALVRAGLHHGPWSWTMKDVIFSCSNLMVQLPWSDLLNHQFTKPWDPSLGVNRMWTKRNDQASKNECVDFFNICPKRAFLENFKFDHSLYSLVFIFSSSKKFIKNLS